MSPDEIDAILACALREANSSVAQMPVGGVKLHCIPST
jgi:hypothetical protein